MKKKRILIISITILTVALIALTVCLIISAWVKSSVKDKIVDASETENFDAECILVLGAMVRDGKPSAMLRDRLDRAIEIHFEKGIPLLMSGDCSSDNYDEVAVMREYALEKGVLPESVLTDPEGYSTFESVTRLKDNFGFKSAIVVTQRYHLYRALFICEKADISALGVAAEDISYRGEKVRLMREVAARVKDFFYTMFI